MQAVTDIFEWPELIAVTDLASAQRAIEVIVEQGEGARGDWMRSHFGTFVGILEDLLAVQAADPTFCPSRPIAGLRPAAPRRRVGNRDRRPHHRAGRELFSGLYEVVLQVLSRFYIHHGETAAELDTLARTAKHLMNWVMRELGPVLTAMPVGPSRPGSTAGPAFDIARPATFVLPHRTRPGRSSRSGSRARAAALSLATKQASAPSPSSQKSCTRWAKMSDSLRRNDRC